MNRASNILQSVFTISTEHESHPRSFGTAFLIHKDRSGSYLVTCSHVVEDGYRYQEVLVQSKKARIVASGREYGLDLSILKVADLDTGQPLRLYNSGRKGDRIAILGSKQIRKNPLSYSIDPIRGNLNDSTALQSPARSEIFKGWLFSLDEDCFVDGGYSGAPVIHERSNYVLAVVSQAQGAGNKGRAIATDSIEFLWRQISDEEFLDTAPNIFEDDLKSNLDIDYSLLRDMLVSRQWDLADQLTGYLMCRASGGWNAFMLRNLEKTFDVSMAIGQQQAPSVAQYIENSPRLRKFLERLTNQESQYAQTEIAKEFQRKYEKLGIAGVARCPISVRKLRSFPVIDLNTIDCLWMKYSSGQYGFSTQNRIWMEISNSNKAASDAAWVFCDRVGWHYHSGKMLAHLFPVELEPVLAGQSALFEVDRRTSGIKPDSSRPGKVLAGTYPCRVLTHCVIAQYGTSLWTTSKNRHAMWLAKALSALTVRLEDTEVI